MLIVTIADADGHFGRSSESSLNNAAGKWMPRGHGDVWVTSQGTDRLFIMHGDGARIETDDRSPDWRR